MFKVLNMNTLKKIWDFIKKVGSKIWNYLKNLDSRLLAILLLLAVLAIAILYCKYKYFERKSNEIIYVTNDSLEYYKNKAHEEYVAKNTYIMELNDIKATNEELYKEIKNLKDHPIVVTKTEIQYKHDTITTQVDSIIKQIDDKLYYWSANDSTYLQIAGITTITENGEKFENVISEVSMTAGLTFDLIETKDKQLKVIAKSDNPYIEFNDINSAVLDPKESKVLKSYFKPKRFGVGPYVGGGLTVTPDGKFIVTPSVGLAVTWDIIQF